VWQLPHRIKHGRVVSARAADRADCVGILAHKAIGRNRLPRAGISGSDRAISERESIEHSRGARHKATREAYAFLMPTLSRMRMNGQTFQQIATALNSDGHTTTTGKP
jgi:hypothetical protein